MTATDPAFECDKLAAVTMSTLYQKVHSLSWLKDYAYRGAIGFRRSALTIGASFVLGTTYMSLQYAEQEIKAMMSPQVDGHRALRNQRDQMLYNQTIWLQKHYDDITKQIEEQKQILQELKKTTSSFRTREEL